MCEFSSNILAPAMAITFTRALAEQEGRRALNKRNYLIFNANEMREYKIRSWA